MSSYIRPNSQNEIYFWELVPHPQNCTARFVPRASANPRSGLPYARQIRVPFTSKYFLLCILAAEDRDVTARLGSCLLSIIISHFRPTIDPAATHATVVSPIRYPIIILKVSGTLRSPFLADRTPPISHPRDQLVSHNPSSSARGNAVENCCGTINTKLRAFKALYLFYC